MNKICHENYFPLFLNGYRQFKFNPYDLGIERVLGFRCSWHSIAVHLISVQRNRSSLSKEIAKF